MLIFTGCDIEGNLLRSPLQGSGSDTETSDHGDSGMSPKDDLHQSRPGEPPSANKSTFKGNNINPKPKPNTYPTSYAYGIYQQLLRPVGSFFSRRKPHYHQPQYEAMHSDRYRHNLGRVQETNIDDELSDEDQSAAPLRPATSADGDVDP